MNHSTQPLGWPQHKPPCCTPTQAAAWLDCLADLALTYGDDDARRVLPEAAQHYLDAILYENKLSISRSKF